MVKIGRVGLGLFAGAALLLAGRAGAHGQSSTQQSSSSSQQSSKASSARHSVSGKVKSVDQKELTLSNGEQLRLTDQTKFMRNGKSISRDEVKPGEQVRASFEPRGKEAYATEIQVQGQGKSSHQGSKASTQPSGKY